ncbi:ribonuclease H-like domain-containing protein [Tanacetum coccineum]
MLAWSAKRQAKLSRSSAEAEYRGVANVVAKTARVHNLLCRLHALVFTATLVYCDNVSDVYLSNNPVQHQRTKHITLDIHFIRDFVAKGLVRVMHVPSRCQCADIFTKGLASSLFQDFRSSLNVRRFPAPTADVFTVLSLSLLGSIILQVSDIKNELTPYGFVESMKKKVIMEYLVNISKRCAFWSLNEDILKITVLTTNTPYPSRKIRHICACTHQRPRRKHDQYAVSREDKYAVLEIYSEFIQAVNTAYSLTIEIRSIRSSDNKNDKECSQPMSGMDDDLFTYKVEVTNIPCDSNKDDDSEQRVSHEANDDMGYDPSDVGFTEWLGSKFFIAKDDGSIINEGC